MQSNSLDDQPFRYEQRKDGSLSVLWHGKPVTMMRGAAATKLTKKLNAAPTEHARQLLLAKATGNFKRGNERM